MQNYASQRATEMKREMDQYHLPCILWDSVAQEESPWRISGAHEFRNSNVAFRISSAHGVDVRCSSSSRLFRFVGRFSQQVISWTASVLLPAAVLSVSIERLDSTRSLLRLGWSSPSCGVDAALSRLGVQPGFRWSPDWIPGHGFARVEWNPSSLSLRWSVAAWTVVGRLSEIGGSSWPRAEGGATYKHPTIGCLSLYHREGRLTSSYDLDIRNMRFHASYTRLNCTSVGLAYCFNEHSAVGANVSCSPSSGPKIGFTLDV